ncbi:MAG: RNA polymerase sigma factor [Brevinematales bacterium]|nr:RNA polymerase sigma factor [Brevinematales bacterium]
MEEKELISEIKKGNLSAFDILVSIYEKRIFSTAYYYTRNRADAEDITQEVFWKVFSQIKKFDENKGFYTWIYTILINTLKTFFNKSRKNKKIELNEEFIDNVVFNPSFEINSIEKISLLKAMEKLDEIEEVIFLLRYNNGLSIKEIAELLSLTEENVKVKIFRGKEKLLNIINEKEVKNERK